MKSPSQENLLGYVLGALDAQEQRDLEKHIDQNPELEVQLLKIKTAMQPLDYIDTAGPRPGLARRACEAVANWQNENGTDVEAIDSSFANSDALALAMASDRPSEGSTPRIRPAAHERILHPTSWSIPDVLVGMALVAICAGLLFPAISYQRYTSRLVHCENNLRQVGVAMLNFSSMNDGSFVAIPRGGNMAASGCYGPILKDAGLLSDDSLLACAGIASEQAPVHIPSVDQVECAECDVELSHYRRTMGGHYGYSMGYCENDRYCSPRNMGRSNVVLLADQPSVDLEGRRSANHRGRGQNCLFEDGRVMFVTGHSYGNDALFENDYGLVGPGTDAMDNVIAPSHLSPIQLERLETMISPTAR
ncbi:MAG: hypothetical protein AB8B55_13810 [Mariniblastus sp.]